MRVTAGLTAVFPGLPADCTRGAAITCASLLSSCRRRCVAADTDDGEDVLTGVVVLGVDDIVLVVIVLVVAPCALLLLTAGFPATVVSVVRCSPLALLAAASLRRPCSGLDAVLLAVLFPPFAPCVPALSVSGVKTSVDAAVCRPAAAAAARRWRGVRVSSVATPDDANGTGEPWAPAPLLRCATGDGDSEKDGEAGVRRLVAVGVSGEPREWGEAAVSLRGAGVAVALELDAGELELSLPRRAVVTLVVAGVDFDVVSACGTTEPALAALACFF